MKVSLFLKVDNEEGLDRVAEDADHEDQELGKELLRYKVAISNSSHCDTNYPESVRY